jgi:hypothetical protein
MMAPNETIILLSREYKVHGQETDRLTLREIKCKDMRKHHQLFNGKDAGIPEMMNLVLDLSGWTQSALDDLAMSDVIAVVEALGDFLEGQGAGGTGGKPSL